MDRGRVAHRVVDRCCARRLDGRRARAARRLRLGRCRAGRRGAGAHGVAAAAGLCCRRHRPATVVTVPADKLPIQMLHDRVLVSIDVEAAERRSSAGIVIPATARMGKRLAWAEGVAVGANVRTVVLGDRVLFDPEERAEVELHGTSYVLLRERDIHAIASERLDEAAAPGLYL